MKRKVYIDGEMIPEDEAAISVVDSAVLVGDSVMELARTFHHKIFRWPLHRDRLLRSIKGARMTFGMTPSELDQVTQEFLETNLPTIEADDEAFVGHLLSRRNMGLGPVGQPVHVRDVLFPDVCRTEGEGPLLRDRTPRGHAPLATYAPADDGPKDQIPQPLALFNRRR